MAKIAHSGNADMDAIERQGRALDEQESRQDEKVKHSPAPWENGRDANGEFIVFQDERIIGPNRNEQYQLNRALCDAAPELLETLSEINIEHDPDTGSVWVIFRPSGPSFSGRIGFQITVDPMDEIILRVWERKVSAAITKATGGK